MLTSSTGFVKPSLLEKEKTLHIFNCPVGQEDFWFTFLEQYYGWLYYWTTINVKPCSDAPPGNAALPLNLFLSCPHPSPLRLPINNEFGPRL